MHARVCMRVCLGCLLDICSNKNREHYCEHVTLEKLVELEREQSRDVPRGSLDHNASSYGNKHANGL